MLNQSEDPAERLLRGASDIHVHTWPDVHARRSSNDFEAATEARDAGMRAIVLKSHHVVTSDRAYLVRKIVPGIEVFGGVALDASVGGLNAEAVRTAAAFVPELPTCRLVWMPTFDGAHFRRHRLGRDGGIDILRGGQLVPEVYEILDVVAEHDLALSTGHLSFAEQVRLLPQAREQGVNRLVVTHPEADYLDFTPDQQRELVSHGAVLEHCYGHTNSGSPDRPAQTSFEKIAANILAVGPEHSLLSSDLGPESKPRPVAGLRMFIQGMLDHGISPQDVHTMVATNPARLLGLD